jgi:threonine/homoserine/homoserine lactone efflux protein
VLTYLLIGMAIGALTGVPIGPVNVAVIDSAYRHNLRRAIGCASGGALADGLYAMLGILGVGPILERHPSVPPILYAISGVVLVVYGILTVRTQPAEAVPEVKRRIKPVGHFRAGFVVGVALILMNPAAIVTWVIIVGSFMTSTTVIEGTAASVGVTLGSFAWFTLVAYLADHGKKVLGDKSIWVTRIVGILLIGYGFYSLGRAGWYWFG